MAERGYSKELHENAPQGRGCGCQEEFEHEGKCQNALREKKSMKCAPCSQGWHYPYPCNDYLSKGYPTLTHQCNRCGWDSAEHPITEQEFRHQRDSRVKRDEQGRYPGWQPGD